jgi:acyl carrier protein
MKQTEIEMTNSVEDRICKLMKETCDEELAATQEGLSLKFEEDLGLDSLDVLSLSMEVEAHWNIKFTYDEELSIHTVADLAKLVREKLVQRVQAIVGAILECDPRSLDPNASWEKLSVDSELTIDMICRVEQEFKISIKDPEFDECCHNIAEFARFLETKLVG